MKVLFSVEQATNTNQQNQKATKQAMLTMQAKGWKVTPCLGCYNGKQETSFMVHVLNFAQLDEIKAMAARHKQECILTMLDNHSHAALVFPNGSREELGTFKQVSQFAAKQCDNYTVMSGKYYVCE